MPLAYPSAARLAQLDAEIAELRRRERELLNRRAAESAKRGVFLCTCCREVEVFPTEGQDTCDACLRRI